MKEPPNLPKTQGERVRLRGRTAVGELLELNERKWAWVRWDAGSDAPKLCHLHELERINAKID